MYLFIIASESELDCSVLVIKEADERIYCFGILGVGELSHLISQQPVECLSGPKSLSRLESQKQVILIPRPSRRKLG